MASILKEAPDTERKVRDGLKEENEIKKATLLLSESLVPYLVAEGDLSVKLVEREQEDPVRMQS